MEDVQNDEWSGRPTISLSVLRLLQKSTPKKTTCLNFVSGLRLKKDWAPEREKSSSKTMGQTGRGAWAEALEKSCQG